MGMSRHVRAQEQPTKVKRVSERAGRDGRETTKGRMGGGGGGGKRTIARRAAEVDERPRVGALAPQDVARLDVPVAVTDRMEVAQALRDVHQHLQRRWQVGRDARSLQARRGMHSSQGGLSPSKGRDTRNRHRRSIKHHALVRHRGRDAHTCSIAPCGRRAPPTLCAEAATATGVGFRRGRTHSSKLSPFSTTIKGGKINARSLARSLSASERSSLASTAKMDGKEPRSCAHASCRCYSTEV